jgi:2,3-bisphosphoglycerate-independent phosphoglycerate mutase
MSAYEVKDALLGDLQEHDYDVVILNFANCDMVGHTADLNATIRAVETVDECVGEIAHYLEQ